MFIIIRNLLKIELKFSLIRLIVNRLTIKIDYIDFLILKKIIICKNIFNKTILVIRFKRKHQKTHFKIYIIIIIIIGKF